MVEHQRVFVVLKIASIAKRLFKSGAVPLYHSLVTFLSRCRHMDAAAIFEIK